MRKRLLYIIGTFLLLAGCHNNNHPYLRRAEEMWGKGKYDSVQYYLVQVDSSALKGEAMYNYYWLRMMALQPREVMAMCKEVLAREEAFLPMKQSECVIYWKESMKTTIHLYFMVKSNKLG